ncbi:hypothetical protein [Aliterella atlantica]|uniref:hypothetical protein n=1 Tax=Aliterella atlantica TaxID=1827278 RepID=UPI0013648ECD
MLFCHPSVAPIVPDKLDSDRWLASYLKRIPILFAALEQGIITLNLIIYTDNLDIAT